MKNNSDRHFYLYAKRHYVFLKKEEDFDTLKKIQGEIYALHWDYVTLLDIQNNLLGLVFIHIKTEREFIDFHKRISMRSIEFHNRESSDITATIKGTISTCLSILSWTKIQDIPFELGKPDLFNEGEK